MKKQKIIPLIICFLFIISSVVIFTQNVKAEVPQLIAYWHPDATISWHNIADEHPTSAATNFYSAQAESLIISNSNDYWITNIDVTLKRVGTGDGNYKFAIFNETALIANDIEHQFINVNAVTIIGALIDNISGTTFSFGFNPAIYVPATTSITFGVYCQDKTAATTANCLQIAKYATSNPAINVPYRFINSAWQTGAQSICFNMYGYGEEPAPTATPNPNAVQPRIYVSGNGYYNYNPVSDWAEDSNLTITAIANSGWRFDHFARLGDSSNITIAQTSLVFNATGACYTYTFQHLTSDNRTFFVVFLPLDDKDADGTLCNLRITVVGAGTYSIIGVSPYYVGDTVTITAIPSANSSFVSMTRDYYNYTGGSRPNPYTFMLMKATETITITFTNVDGTSGVTPTPTATPDKFTPVLTSISNFLFGDAGVLGAGFGLIVLIGCCVFAVKLGGRSLEMFVLGVVVATIINVAVGIWELWTIIVIIISVVAVALRNSGVLNPNGE
jgi:hypothetical protein